MIRSARPAARHLHGHTRHDVGLGWTSTDTIGSITDHVYAAQSSSFGYDANDRLASVTKSGDNQVFAHDRADNRTAHSRASWGWSYALQGTANRVASISGSSSRSFAYDGGNPTVGNLSVDSLGPRSYQYDGFNRMRSATVAGATTTTYASSALNQRVSKTSAAGTTYYIHAPSGELLLRIPADRDRPFRDRDRRFGIVTAGPQP